MATITSTPSDVSIKFSNKNSTSASGTISWSSPSVPNGATVTSCVLTGTITPTSAITSATVGGKTISTSGSFSVDLGTSITTSASVSLAKAKGSACTVKFANMIYTVTYTEPVAKPTYTVTFKDWDGATLKTQTVEEGASATAPSNPSRVGYNFTGWDKSFNNVTANVTITAQYSIKSYTVTFKDWNGTTLKTETVNHGSNATAPSNPTREGYEFTGWDVSFNNVTRNLIVTAQYIDSGEPEKDVIEWNGIGTVATGLRAHDVEHNNYKINIDWNTQCFDIIVTKDFNYLSGINNINIALLDKIIIGNNIYTPELHVNNDNINITIYDSTDGISNYDIERNYPYTIRFNKEGVYVLYESTSHLIMERDYDLDHIYFNEDGLNNEPLSGNENDDYDVAFDLAVSEYSGQTEEPEEDVIEWTGVGTVATGLNSGIKHDNYKINLDWDNEYFDIILQSYTDTGNDVADTKVCSLRINNNTYDYYFSEGSIVLRQGLIDICECYPYVLPNTLRFSKDGIYCLYEEENVKIGEIEYGNDNVIYVLEDDEYNTDFSMNFDLVVSERPNEELKENIFPSFITEEWGTNGTFTIIEESDYNIRFTADAPWSGPLYYAPYYWQGKTITLSCDTMSENTKFDIMTTSWGALFELTPENSPLTVTLPNEPIMFCLQSSAPDAGVTREVYATGLRITSEDSFENVPDAITSLNINKDIYYVGLGEEIIISCTVTPLDGVYGNLTWTANNPDLLLIEDGKSCIAVSDVIGNYTLTVTDSLTGLSDSCNIVVDDLISGELFPPFTNGQWYLNSTCTEILKEDYSYSFECTEPWTAVSISIPDYWYGKSIKISCEDISENAGLYIQETDNWVEIGKLTLSSKSAILHVPNKGDYTDIIIALQAPTTPGIVSITNVTASLYGLDNDEDDGEGDIVEDFYNGKINLQYENRLIGYKKPDAEEIVEDAIICTNIGEVSRALSSVQPGQTIYLRRGKYVFGGSFIIRAAGTEGNYVTIKGYPGESVIISDTKLEFANPAKYLNFENLIIANVPDLHWGYAIKVHSGTSYINFRNLEIRNITCKIPEGSTETTTGCNPLVIYGDTVEGINNVNVENCYIHDCDTGWSEGLTLNGHVSNCLIKNCTIANITNIGIDLAGNYEWTGTVGDPENQTHDCIVENCLLVNCQSPYATSAGLYSDGARDNTFRYNVMYNCQCGIELGSEQPGAASENFYIHNNLIIDSGRAIGVGSYQETGAPNRNAYIYNNTIVCGDSNKENYGLYVERTDNVNFYNNIVYGTSNTTLFSNYYNSNVNVGNNCWYQQNGSKPEIDSTGIFENNIFINNDLTLDGDYSLRHTSPCVNKGNSEVFDSEEIFDLAGNPRIIGEGIDIGAFEHSGQTEEDIIEWTGLGTVATGLRAHDVGHNNYKINIDWNTQCFDIIVTEDFNYLSGIIDVNIANLDKIIIGDNIYTPELYVNNDNINITIYVSTDEFSNYDIRQNYLYNMRLANTIERNYPYTIRFTKEGVYILYGSTSHLIMERDYDLDTIYFNEDRIDNEPLSGNENGDYDVAFDLAVNEYSGQTEEPGEDPETPLGITIAQYKFNSSIDTLPTFNSEFTYKYTDANNGDGTITRTITSDSSPTSISFSGKTGLVSVSYLDTSNVTDMSYMFYQCNNLTTLDVSSFDTTNVTTIETMFAYCSNLLTVTGLNDLDVSNVNNMGGLFSDCSNITEINVSDWNVSKVTNFGAIFRRCPKLTNIDVSKWDTSSGIIMSGIFTNDSSLIELDLSSWDMSHANSVSQMFYGCSALMKLKMCANLNQDAVTTYWFGKCNSLNDVQLSDFDTYTINKVIDELPTRTANNQGSLIIPKIDSSINTSTADSKYWIVSPDPTNIRHMHLGDMVISNLYIGEVEIKKVCLGEIIIYENKQAAADKDTLYNEFTGALFILKEDALSYDEEELALNINSDIINANYNEENLDIGGDK